MNLLKLALLLPWLGAITLTWADNGEYQFLLQGGNDQTVLSAPTLTASRNYSVGFSLASTYGSAAVIVDDAQDGEKTYTWFVYGDSAYRETMIKLSLDKSRHLA
jgi:hypothetical protein